MFITSRCCIIVRLHAAAILEMLSTSCTLDRTCPVCLSLRGHDIDLVYNSPRSIFGPHLFCHSNASLCFSSSFSFFSFHSLFTLFIFFFFLIIRPPPRSPLFPYTTLFR